MKVKTTINGIQSVELEVSESHPVEISSFDGKTNFRIVDKKTDNHFTVERNGKKFDFRLLTLDKELKKATVKVNGELLHLHQENEFDALLKSLGMGAGAVKKVNDMKAPMPGVVLEVKVSAGDEVEKDQPVLVLEAMKMENMLKSPIEGTISSVEIKEGETVDKNKVLITFEQ